MSFAICTYKDDRWKIVKSFIPFLEDAKRYNPTSKERHFIIEQAELEKNNRFPRFYLFYDQGWTQGNPKCVVSVKDGVTEIEAKFDSLVEATQYQGIPGQYILPLEDAYAQNVPDTLEWNASSDSWVMKKGTDLFSQGWPEGREFTIGLRVVNPGEMARFFTHSEGKELLYGCQVLRVDFQDRVCIMDEKKKRIAELLAELMTELEN